MSEKAPHRIASGFFLRHYVELLTLIALLFVMQTGLVPFDFFRNAGEGITGDFFDVKVYDLQFPDIVSNIFLYVPLAAMLHWCLVLRIRSKLISAILAMAFTAILSGFIEYIQAYSPSRISSLIDWVSNVLGAILGVCLSWIFRWMIPRFVESALRECKQKPQLVLLITYCFALVVIATSPYSFSFDFSRLKQCVKSTNISPFTISQADALPSDPNVEQGSNRAQALARWHVMKTHSRWAAECVSFMVLVWLLQPVLRRYYGFGRVGTFLLIWWIAGGLAIALSLLQIPVISRASDITDVIFRLFGIALGMMIQTIFYLRKTLPHAPETRAPFWRKPARFGCAVAFLFVVYSGVIPLDFTGDTATWQETTSSYGFLPFFAYFLARFDLMMTDAMGKFLMYVVFALLFAAGSSRLADQSLKSRLLIITLCTIVLSTIIEIVQLFIPVRVTSLTDPILAVAGTIVGVVGYHYAVMFYCFALSQGVEDLYGTESQPVGPTGLSTADAMMADLAEPRDDAPVEPDPSAVPVRRHTLSS